MGCVEEVADNLAADDVYAADDRCELKYLINLNQLEMTVVDFTYVIERLIEEDTLFATT